MNKTVLSVMTTMVSATKRFFSSSHPPDVVAFPAIVALSQERKRVRTPFNQLKCEIYVLDSK